MNVTHLWDEIQAVPSEDFLFSSDPSSELEYRGIGVWVSDVVNVSLPDKFLGDELLHVPKLFMGVTVRTWLKQECL